MAKAETRRDTRTLTSASKDGRLSRTRKPRHSSLAPPRTPRPPLSSRIPECPAPTTVATPTKPRPLRPQSSQEAPPPRPTPFPGCPPPLPLPFPSLSTNVPPSGPRGLLGLEVSLRAAAGASAVQRAGSRGGGGVNANQNSAFCTPFHKIGRQCWIGGQPDTGNIWFPS